MKHNSKIVCLFVVLLFTLQGNRVLAQSEGVIKSWRMPIPLDELRPITVENAQEVIELGWLGWVSNWQRSEWLSAISPDATLTTWRAADGTVIVAKTSSGEVVMTIPYEKHGGDIRTIVLSPNNAWLALSAGYRPSVVQVWDISNSGLLFSLNIDGFVQSLAFSSDSRQLAIAPEYIEKLLIVDVEQGEITRTLPIGEYSNFVAFSPDGKQLAVSTGWTVRVWDTDSYQEVFSTLHFGGRDVVYSTDSSLIGTGIEDGKVHVLDALTGELITQTPMYGDTELVFGAENTLVIIANNDKLWFRNTQKDEITFVIDNGPYGIGNLSADAQAKLLVFDRGDIHFYGAPNCAISAAERTNLRSSSSTSSSIGGALQPGELGFVVGKQVDDTGHTWWKLSDGLWVHSDIVTVASGCHEVRDVQA